MEPLQEISILVKAECPPQSASVPDHLKGENQGEHLGNQVMPILRLWQASCYLRLIVTARGWCLARLCFVSTAGFVVLSLE
jgi:hypothetical protein